MTEKPALVVALCHENPWWIEQLREHFWVRIYKKGDNKGEWDYTLPNVGREAHTYFWHIVNFYSGLRGDTIFCQGDPFGHDTEFLTKVLDPAIRTYGMTLDSEPDGGPQVHWCPLHAYCEVLGLPKLDIYRFAQGAQFRVSAEQIHARPLEFYKAALGLCSLKEVDGGVGGSPAPWVFERLFDVIFGLNL